LKKMLSASGGFASKPYRGSAPGLGFATRAHWGSASGPHEAIPSFRPPQCPLLKKSCGRPWRLIWGADVTIWSWGSENTGFKEEA